MPPEQINPVEAPYLALLAEVRRDGRCVPTRAVLPSTGKTIDALSVFGRQVRYDLAAGFPAVTTKRLAFGPVVHELIWFLKGSPDISYLHEHGVRIWDPWIDEKGNLGPVYGKQWRSWAAPDGRTIDQIAAVVRGIERLKEDPTDPVGRRLIVSAWNPADIEAMALPPCHTMFQFSLTEGRLSCQLYQRSADLFLGVPFNIASYALLTHLVAHVTGVQVGEFVHTIGDAHIYTNHLEQVDEQLSRSPFPPPTLRIDPAVSSLDEVRREQIALENYRHHPTLKGEVAV